MAKDDLIEKIRRTLESDRLVLDIYDSRELEELIRKKGDNIIFDSENIEINGQILRAVSFVYPKKELSEILSEVRDGKVHSLEEEYSEHIVQYTDTGRYSAHFNIRRYEVNRVYLPNFRETVFFARKEYLSWTTVVAGFDDSEDVGDGIYECDWNQGTIIYGPLDNMFLRKFFGRS